ncbi:MAG TPA: cytochrome c oxidase subunit 2A [Terriglobales bacterium]|nr:cytochrome c oxidase subunit 2A [Terriglobales bacterium]
MKEPEPKPKGTIAILVVFAIVTLLLWGSLYAALLLRGVTQ